MNFIQKIRNKSKEKKFIRSDSKKLFSTKDIVNFKLETISDFHHETNIGSLFIEAVIYNKTKLIDYLLNNFIDIHEKGGVCEDVLFISCQHDFYKITKLLIERGVDVNAENRLGETPLNVAYRFGSDKCADLLIENGGKIFIT